MKGPIAGLFPAGPLTNGMSRRGFLKCGLGALAAPSLLGCGGFPSAEDSQSGVRLSARPGSPTGSPKIGASRLGIADGRDGILYVPESYSPDTPIPLFIGLHGAGGDADSWVSYHARAESRGMVLMATESRSKGTWDRIANGSFGPDVRFLDRALKHVFDRCRIDPARIVLGGFSDGASYALSLGISNGDLFTRLVAFSPGSYYATDPIVGSPAMFVSHGREDTILPVTTTRDFIVPAFRDTGYDVTYEEFTGGHGVPAAIAEAALDWFLGTG
jgi:phospholipase/carboxylesterase